MKTFEQTNGPDGDEDIIVIHLGRVLKEYEYDAVVEAVVKFLNKRFPGHNFTIPS